ncbi:hypothetical protein ILUMI_20114, partial [Ignelater luminosus]
ELLDTKKELSFPYASPTLLANDHLNRLKTNTCFTGLDLTLGHHQTPLLESSVSKPAFIAPDGHYKYLRICFGLGQCLSTVSKNDQ